MKKLMRMLAATVNGRAVMVMEAEGEPAVAYDLGTEGQAGDGDRGIDVDIAKDMAEKGLGAGTHVIQEVGVVWVRPTTAV